MLRKPGPNEWINYEHGFPPKVLEFIEWYIQPRSERSPSSALAWSKENDVSYNTLQQWKKDDRVRKEMNKRAEQLNISSFRTQEVINSLYQAAVGGDVKAMTSYLEYVKLFQPSRKLVIENSSIADKTDEEIRAFLAEEGLV